MIALVFFMTVSAIISYIDLKEGLILDKIMFPAIIILTLIKYFDSSLSMNDLIAIVIIFLIFLVPILLNMAFGGGDLRFGVFCALFLGLKLIGIFIIAAGLVHLIILLVLRKKSFAFAPAMSIAAITVYLIGNL